MKHLIFPTQVVLFVTAVIIFGIIADSIYRFVLSIPWLAGSVTFLFIVGFLYLLHFVSKRVWD